MKSSGNSDSLYTWIGLGLVIVGGIVLFSIAKAALVFLLEHWLIVLGVLFAVVGTGIYLLSKDGK